MYFDVYGRFDVAPVRGLDCEVFDADGRRYLDLYGGHGVISLGHAHPAWVEAIREQAGRLAFYSNAVRLPQQDAYATRLAELSGYGGYRTFLVNSGAEANENALKLASFETGRRRYVAFRGGWHGRTAGALGVTDDAKLFAPVNEGLVDCTWLALGDGDALRAALAGGDVAAVIVEGVQGVGGLDAPDATFLRDLREACDATGTWLILDEIQSGFARTGRFFAHQHVDADGTDPVRADVVTMAKGMGNGFPVGGLLIRGDVAPRRGSLGTTFGGSPLAVAAADAVLAGLADGRLQANAAAVGAYAAERLAGVPGVERVKGRGLMLGVRMQAPVAELRRRLLHEHGIFTGGSNDAHLLRILPPLTCTTAHVDELVAGLRAAS